MEENKEEIVLSNKTKNNAEEMIVTIDADLLDFQKSSEDPNGYDNPAFNHEEPETPTEKIELIRMHSASNEQVIRRSLELFQSDPSLNRVSMTVGDGFESLERDDLMMYIEALEENRDFVVGFTSKSKSTFYWRFNGPNPIFELEVECSQKLAEFIIHYLKTSIDNKNNGLLSSFQYNPDALCFQTELVTLGDSRGFNLLALASESASGEVVEELIELGFDVHIAVEGQTAADLAYESRNYGALLKLLKANSLYPTGFDASTLDSDASALKSFVELSANLHDSIKSNNLEVVREILETNPYKDLKHFYDTSNNSAVTCALVNEQFGSFEILTMFKFIFGPKEDFDGIIGGLDRHQKLNITKIHEKHSQSLLEKHLSILVANSSFGHDAKKDDTKFSIVARAFRILNENPFISIILKIVAASRNFKIIFDFNRSNVRFLDPNSEPYMNGLFYESGRILIGACDLLDSSREHIVFGVLAHELTHYAMFLVFQNQARPYYDFDKKSEQFFDNILLDCEKNKEHEEIIELAFANPPHMLHAELIVRIPHILAHYHNDKSFILENRLNFGSLFIFYQDVVMPKLKQALPQIEGESEKDIKGKYLKAERKLSLIRWSFTFALFVLLLLIPVFFVFSNPQKVHWNDLISSQRNLIKDNLVTYRDVELKFSELFNDDAEVYKTLETNQILSVLHYGKNLTDAIYKNNLNSSLMYDWKNLPKSLRNKVKNSIVNFQGAPVNLNQTLKSSSKVFSHFDKHQIDDLLSNRIIDVGSNFERNQKFIERFFLEVYDTSLDNDELEEITEHYQIEAMTDAEADEDSEEITTIQTLDTEVTTQFYEEETTSLAIMEKDTTETICLQTTTLFPHEEDLEMTTLTSEEQGSSQVLKILNQVKESNPAENNPISESNENILTVDRILGNLEATRMFILSDGPGTGKTAVFEYFRNITKEHFPTHWTGLIIMKDHLKVFKEAQMMDLNDSNQIKDLLINKMLNLTSLEAELFSELFTNGKVILLWDGFDEVASEYEELLTNIFKKIYDETGNIQLISSRPEYTEELSKNLGAKLYKIGPFNKQDREVFLSQILSKDAQGEYLKSLMARVQNFIYKTETDKSRKFNRPIMLQLLAEAAQNPDEIDLSNIFMVFKTFVDKRLTAQSCDKAKKTQTTELSPFTIHQYYAISILFGNSSGVAHINQLKTIDQATVASYGILTFFNGKLEFIHRTFAEFFVSRFFAYAIHDLRWDLSEDQVRTRLQFFIKTISENKLIREFLKNYLESPIKSKTPFKDSIKKAMRTTFKNILRGKRKETATVIEMFFAKDPEISLTIKLFGGKFGRISKWLSDNFNIKTPKGISLEEDSSEKIAKAFVESSQIGNILYQTWANVKDNVTTKVFLRVLGLNETKKYQNYSQMIQSALSTNETSFYNFYEKDLKNLSQTEKKNLICDNFGEIFIDKVQNFEEFYHFWSIFNSSYKNKGLILKKAKNKIGQNILSGLLKYEKENVSLILIDVRSLIGDDEVKMLVNYYEGNNEISQSSQICKIESLKIYLTEAKKCETVTEDVVSYSH